MKSIFSLVLIVVTVVNANTYYDFSNEDYTRVKDSRNFTGKVVLVTGSNTGIGEGTVKLFSILGAQVVVTGRKAAEVKRVAQEVQELSPKKLKALEVVGDVTNSTHLETLINETIKTFGRLDVLVNNAGVLWPSAITDKNYMKNYDSIMSTNLRAAVELTHLAVPYLQKTNGSIVHVSSLYSLSPHASVSAYSMSKAAMDMMTKCLAIELGPLGIRVNAINPGIIMTQMNAIVSLDKNFKEQVVKQTPLHRFGEALDIAKGVVFLSSSDASFVSGANLVITGGLFNFHME